MTVPASSNPGNGAAFSQPGGLSVGGAQPNDLGTSGAGSVAQPSANAGLPNPIEGLGAIGDALGKIADFFVTVKDGVGKILGVVTSKSTWKGLGLMVAGAAIVAIGVLVWTGIGSQGMKAAETTEGLS